MLKLWHPLYGQGSQKRSVLDDALDELAASRAWRERAMPLLSRSQKALDAAIDNICEECGIDRPFMESQYAAMMEIERDLRQLLTDTRESEAKHAN